MTAELAVLNKSAVALAVDSTVTVADRKTYNSADKQILDAINKRVQDMTKRSGKATVSDAICGENRLRGAQAMRPTTCISRRSIRSERHGRPARARREWPAARGLVIEQLEDRSLLADVALMPLGAPVLQHEASPAGPLGPSFLSGDHAAGSTTGSEAAMASALSLQYGNVLNPDGQPPLTRTGDALDKVDSQFQSNPFLVAFSGSGLDVGKGGSFSFSYGGDPIEIYVAPTIWAEVGDQVVIFLHATASSQCDRNDVQFGYSVQYDVGLGWRDFFSPGQLSGPWESRMPQGEHYFVATVGSTFAVDIRASGNGGNDRHQSGSLAFNCDVEAAAVGFDPHDIEMLSTEIDADDRATDHQTVKFEYAIHGKNMHDFEVGVYRSADETFDPDPKKDVPVGELVSVHDTSPGKHTGTWKGLLKPDTFRPYVLVVADPDNRVTETLDVEDNTAYFRKYLIGAVTHGFEMWGGLTDWKNHWAPKMATALKARAHYDTAFAFSWLSSSNDPVPEKATQAGSDMLNAVINEANKLIASEHLSPNDAIDVHWIGHSRGSVVISEALKAFAQHDPGTIPKQLRRAYMKMTMLDPHAARNQDQDPQLSVLCSYDKGLNIVSWLPHEMVRWFQARAFDPEPEATFAHEAEVYYQNTDYFLTPPGHERVINLWGETISGATRISYTREPWQGYAVGHGEVPLLYLQRTVPASQTFAPSVPPPDAEVATSDVDFLYPQYVDERRVAETLVAHLAAAKAAYEDDDFPTATASLNTFLQTIDAERPHIEPATADWMSGDAQLFIRMLETSLQVTVNQTSGQADPTSESPIHFTAVFSGPVGDFTKEDVSLSGTAGATTVVVTPGGTAQTFDVAVSGMTHSGSVIVTIPADVAHDGDGVGNLASTSDDNKVSYNQVEPSLSIDDPQPLAEGTKGQTTLSFNVRLTQPVSQPVKVKYATANGTAISGKDFQGNSGTLTFSPGKPLVQTIRVSIINDKLYEDAESLQVILSNATGALIARATAAGTILDNDPMPTLSIADKSVSEGEAGTTEASFTVTLSAASGKTTTVSYATADGTATLADDDYQARGGVLTFAPNVTKQTITILVNRDTKYELNETFLVELSNPANATLTRSAATGKIKNDDPAPRVLIADVTINETAGAAVFTLTLSAASGAPVTVNYATANKTALSPGDYTAKSGTVSFAPGSTTATISVAIIDDALSEASETFQVKLSGAVGAKLSRTTVTATIVDNDALLVLSAKSLAAEINPVGFASLDPSYAFPHSLIEVLARAQRGSRKSLKPMTSAMADEAIGPWRLG